MDTRRNGKLIGVARSLRKNMTKEEKHLWYDFLCSYPVRFRRQEIIGNYVADFYSDKAKLIIELDGSQHYQKENRENELQRTAYFQSLGINVIRFSNLEVNSNFEGTCAVIIEKIKASPRGEVDAQWPEG